MTVQFLSIGKDEQLTAVHVGQFGWGLSQGRWLAGLVLLHNLEAMAKVAVGDEGISDQN